MADPSPAVVPKVVLITGASSGIGEATARRLAAAGHHVALGARRTDRLAALAEDIGARGGSALPLALDVTDPVSVQSFVAAAHDRFGRVDVLVNNAGVMPLSRLDALRVDEWNLMIDVNLRGVLHGIAAVRGLTRSELTGSIGDSSVKDAVEGQMGIAIPAAAIGEAVLYAIAQPADVDVNELVVRPTAQG